MNTISPKFKNPIFNLSLFISIFIFHFKKPTNNQTLFPKSHNQTNYIVRFIEYKKAEQHKKYLEEQTTKKNKSLNWKWVHRNNPASKFPTDFGVVSINDEAVHLVIKEFERLEMVKDVTVDSSIQLRNLLGGNEREKDVRIGAFSDGKKRDGKIFTSMSFSEDDDDDDDDDDSNHTIYWGRVLNCCYYFVSIFPWFVVFVQVKSRGFSAIVLFFMGYSW